MAAKKKAGGQEELVETLIGQNILLSKKSAETLQQVKMLTSRVDKLVSIFEKASKEVGDIQTGDEIIRSLSDRLSELLEQNKTIASGLIALEKYVRQRGAEQQPGQF
jgi:hypothetical protein